eukprot:scaffold2134_cov384-Prasinococcus_capsulatus_cf.AAC.14
MACWSRRRAAADGCDAAVDGGEVPVGARREVALRARGEVAHLQVRLGGQSDPVHEAYVCCTAAAAATGGEDGVAAAASATAANGDGAAAAVGGSDAAAWGVCVGGD